MSFYTIFRGRRFYTLNSKPYYCLGPYDEREQYKIMSVGRGAFWLCNAWRGCHARVDHNGREATSGKNVIHCRSNMHCRWERAQRCCHRYEWRLCDIRSYSRTSAAPSARRPPRGRDALGPCDRIVLAASSCLLQTGSHLYQMKTTVRSASGL